MKHRKRIKKVAKKHIKQHYWMFVVVCLLTAYLGVEFGFTMNALDITTVEYREPEAGEEIPENGGMIVKNKGALDVWEKLLLGQHEEGKETAQQLEKEAILQSEDANPIFGRSRGVFASAVNAISSGSFFVTIVAAISNMIGSRNVAVLLLLVLGLLLSFSLWFFITNTVLVMSRRIFLEGRTYESVPMRRFLFLLRVKKWTKASWTMFVTYLFQFLWMLTVVGGIVKYYSYFMVPYIVAENPNIKALDAITLSRKMMYGHKWECFLLQLSFIGWDLLGILTLGLSNIFYANPYKICTYSEYYTELREKAREMKVENANLMNDRYLFEKAEDEVILAIYADVLEIMEKPEVYPEASKGLEGFFCKALGIILRNTKADKEYEQYEAEQSRIHELIKEAKGQEYPGRLSAFSEEEKRKRVETIHYMRHYTIWSLIMLFFGFSLIGWMWEVSLHLISDGIFVNRGVLHGPWLPIYGSGGILILTILHKLRKYPALEFIGIVVLCGAVEYGTSYYLEIAHNGKKWWDYSGYFLNLNGRICAEGLLVFGLGGMAIVYFLAPLLDNHIKRMAPKILVPICLSLLLVFAGDQIYSRKNPNTGQGITDYQSRQEISFKSCFRS